MLHSVSLRLIACGLAGEPELLETSLPPLAEYAATAPQWRLDRWSFAATASGRALIRGRPLPPLPGRRWIETGGIAVPAGFDWSPAVEPAVLRQLLLLEPNQVALLHPDGSFERIAADDWVRVTRSAIQNSREAVAP